MKPTNIITENLPAWDGVPILEGHSIEPKFAIQDGDKLITYYQFRDTFRTFSVRGLKALEVYEEWQNRLTNERLRAIFDRLLEEINSDKIKVAVIADIVNKAKERLDWIMPTSDIIRNMAAVGYFDSTESPYEYDASYQIQVKIPLWRKHKVDSFFLGSSLKDLVPFPTISEENFEACQRVMDKLEEIFIEKLKQAS